MGLADSLNELETFLRSSPDFKKELKTLLKSLRDIDGKISETAVSDALTERLVDLLVSETLPLLASATPQERECLALLHGIICAVLRPYALVTSIPVRPLFQFEPLQLEKAPIVFSRIDHWIDVLVEDELKRRTDVFRWILALDSLGCLAEAGQLNAQQKVKIGEACRQVLVLDSRLARISAPLPKVEKPPPTGVISRVRSFRQSSSTLEVQSGFDSEEQEMMILALCNSALTAARKALPESGSSLYEHLAVALGCVRGEIARLAMEFYQSACAFEVDKVQREFGIRLPVSPGTIELSNVSTARSFAQIMLALTSSPTDKTFQALALLVRDARPEVFVLACRMLGEVPWDWLVNHQLPLRLEEHRSERDRRQSTNTGIRLISEIIYRLSEALSMLDKDAIVMSACSAIARLAMARCEWISADVTGRIKSSSDVFFPLSSKLSSICLDSRNDLIKLEASVALCWVGKPSTLGDSIWGEFDSYRLIDALIARLDRIPSLDVMACLLQTLWVFKDVLDCKSAQFALISCLGASNRLTQSKTRRQALGILTQYVLSLLDWSSDERQIKWEMGLLAFLATEWPFQMDSVSLRTLTSFVLRLERVLMFRRTSVACQRHAASALIKIAILCGEPTRIRIYELMFDYLCHSRGDEDIISSNVIEPALAMFDSVYELIVKRETDEKAYANVNRIAKSLCVGIDDDFSFLVQAQMMIQSAHDHVEREEDETEEKDHTEEDEDDSSEPPELPPSPGTLVKPIPAFQGPEMSVFEEEDEDEDD